MIDKTPIENKIPIKTNKYQFRRKDTKKRVILDRNQVKKNKAKRYQDSHNKYQSEQIYGGDIKFQLIPIKGIKTR